MNSRKKGDRQSRSDNSAWTKPTSSTRATSASSKENILHTRCDTDEEGLKTSFAVNLDSIELGQPITREEFANRLEKGLEEASFRPLQELEFNQLGSPLFGKTPGGTKLYKDKKYGAMYVLTNRESAREAYEQSAQYADLNAFLMSIKAKQVTVTDQQQVQVLREKQKANYKRKKSQNAVMGQSAEEHITTHCVALKGVKFEWAHLLAHSLVGAVGQQEDNLVATTAHANTDMIFAEAQLSLFNEQYPQGFDVEVTAHVIDGTHVAQKIEYKITTPDFEKTYEFDAQTNVQPHVLFKRYFHGLANALIPDVNDSPYVLNRTRSRMVDPNTNLFSKNEQASKADALERVKRRKKK